MDSKIKILIGILVVGVLLIGGWWIWNSYFEKISVDGKAKIVFGIDLPLDAEEAVKVVKKFCGKEYKFNSIEDLGGYWIVPYDLPYYAKINKEDGNTKCKVKIITKEVFIDSSTEKVEFWIDWLYKKGDIDLVLRKPDGKIIDRNSITEEKAYEVYKQTNPQRGKWQIYMVEIKPVSFDLKVRLHRYGGYIDEMLDRNVTYPCGFEKERRLKKYGHGEYPNPLKEGDISASIYFNPEKEKMELNEPVKIIVALSQREDPITDAQINVEIKKPDNTSYSLSLYDDGHHDDVMAMDGVYANWYPYTEIPGSYEMRITIEGWKKGKKYSLVRLQSIEISNHEVKKLLSVTPEKMKIDIYPSKDTCQLMSFTVDSNSDKTETVAVTFIDFVAIGEGDIIAPENALAMPSIFKILPHSPTVFYIKVCVPKEKCEGKKYSGHMILQSTANYISVPISIICHEMNYKENYEPKN